MIDIGTLAGRITLEDDGSASMKAFAGNLTDIGSSMSKAGTTLTVGLTAPLVAAAGASLLFSGNFEASMTRLVSLAGVSSGELAGVKQHILDLGPAVGIGPQALADAMMKVSSTVADTGVALSILDISAKGSAAGMGTALDVAGALTAVINSYGSETITAARAADILTKTIQDGGAEAKELAPVLANVVPIAAQMGIKFEEVGANIATLTKLGVPAAEAVTQLSSVFTALLKETKKGGEALASVNMSYAGLREEVKQKGLTEALLHLSSVFKGNETGLTNVFGRIEALRNVMGTAGQQADTYALEIERITNSVGSLDKAFDAMTNTQTFKWGQVTAAMGGVAIQLGDALAPAFGKVLQLALPVVEMLGGAVKAFTSLPSPMQVTVIAFAALLAAVGPVLFVAGQLVIAFTAVAPIVVTVTTYFGGLAGAAALLTNPITIAVAAVLALTAALDYFDLLDPVINFFKDVAAVVSGVALAGFRILAPYVKDVGSILGGIVLTALKDVLQPWITLAGWVKTFANYLGELLLPSLRLARQWLDNLATSFRALPAETGYAKAGADAYHQSLEDFKNPIIDVNMGLTGMVANTVLLTEKVQTHIALTKEQKEAAAALAKQLAGIHKDWDEAARDVGHLTDAQKLSIDAHLDLHHRVEDIAAVMKISKQAVEDYSKEFDKLPGRIKALTTEALHLQPILRVMGFEEAKKHVVSMWTSLNDVGEAAQETSTILETDLNPAVVHVATATVQVSTSLSGVADMFVRMGQASSGAMSGILGGISQLVVMLDAAQKKAQDAGSALGGMQGKIASGLGKLANSTLGQGVLYGIDSGSKAETGGLDASGNPESFSHTMTTGIFGNDAGSATKAVAMGVATMGVSIGVSAAIAGIKYLFRDRTFEDIARDSGEQFGMRFGKATMEAIKTETKTGTRMVVAELLNLDKIIQDAGGLHADNLATMETQFRNVFSNLGQGWSTQAQAVAVLDKNFATFTDAATSNVGVLDSKMVEMIHLNEQFGTSSKAIAEYLGQQGAAGANAFAAALGVTADAYSVLDADQTKLKDLNEQLSTASGSQQDALQKQIADVTKDIATQRGILDATGVRSQAAAEAMAAGVVGSFQGMLDSGMSFHDAVNAIGPAADNLSIILKQTGFSGGAAFDLITGQINLAKDAIAGPALDSVNALSLGMVSLSNMGKLNQDTFLGLSGQIGQTFQSLISQGKDGGQVLIAMQPSLQRLWEEEQQFGFKADEATQALIDEAVASGLVGEKHKSSTDQMIDALGTLHEDLQGIVSVLTGKGGVADAFGTLSATAKSKLGEIPKEITIKVNGDWNLGQPDTTAAVSPDGYATGGVVLQGPWMQGKGTDTTVAALTPGEGVVTTEGMSRIGGAAGLDAINSGTGSSSAEITALRRDVATMTRAVKDMARANAVALQEAILMLPSKVA